LFREIVELDRRIAADRREGLVVIEDRDRRKQLSAAAAESYGGRVGNFGGNVARSD
jgi:hypothetical protein